LNVMALAAPPQLVAITDLTRMGRAQLLDRAAELARAARPGSLAVLLRDHQASARDRLALGRELSGILRGAGHELWVAERLDLALLLDADALHLGEASVAARDARRLLGANRRISRAWHDPGPLSEAGWRELESVDCLLLSPIFEPRKGRAGLGVAALHALLGSLAAHGHGAHVWALGGVSPASAPSCLAAGARGVAAIGAAWSSDAADLVRSLDIAR
jgi:thiamine-phosphate pyrophosphorylase